MVGYKNLDFFSFGYSKKQMTAIYVSWSSKYFFLKISYKNYMSHLKLKILSIQTDFITNFYVGPNVDTKRLYCNRLLLMWLGTFEPSSALTQF